MDSLNEKISALIASSGKSQKKIAEEVGVSPQAVTRWVKSGAISKENLSRLAQVTGASMAWLLGLEEKPTNNLFVNVSDGSGIDVRKLCIVGMDNVGAYAESDYQAEYLEGGSVDYCTKHLGGRTFATSVCGDAMVNSERGSTTFLAGWKLLIDPDAGTMAESYVLVSRKGESEAIFRQLIKEGGRFYLKALNNRYPLLDFEPDMFVCGTVVDALLDGKF